MKYPMGAPMLNYSEIRNDMLEEGNVVKVADYDKDITPPNGGVVNGKEESRVNNKEESEVNGMVETDRREDYWESHPSLHVNHKEYKLGDLAKHCQDMRRRLIADRDEGIACTLKEGQISSSSNLLSNKMDPYSSENLTIICRNMRKQLLDSSE